MLTFMGQEVQDERSDAFTGCQQFSIRTEMWIFFKYFLKTQE